MGLLGGLGKAAAIDSPQEKSQGNQIWKHCRHSNSVGESVRVVRLRFLIIRRHVDILLINFARQRN